MNWKLSMTVAPFAAMILAMIIIQHPLSAPAPDGKLQVHFLDVGQGDSALVVFPDGKTMLIDGGGKPNLGVDDATPSFSPDVPRIGEAVVSEFLWEQGYSRIDYIVATHADADHMQGLVDVAKNFDIGTLMLGTLSVGDAEFDALMDVSAKRGIPITKIRRGDELNISDVRIHVLNPFTDTDSGSQNDSSIVLKIAHGSRSFLMTGDIEQTAEANLIAHGCDAIQADVVKVPHHGSRTSSTDRFVNCTRSSIAIISVGRRSRFGHPHAEVLERWRSSGVQIIKTGDKGTISIATDGNGVEVQTFVP